MKWILQTKTFDITMSDGRKHKDKSERITTDKKILDFTFSPLAMKIIRAEIILLVVAFLALCALWAINFYVIPFLASQPV